MVGPIGVVLVAIGLGAGDGPVPALVRPAEFRAWFDAARGGEAVVTAEAKRRAAGFRYVFVGGFANEQIPGYFDQNARELRALGISRKAIHTIYPSSRETIEESAKSVRERFFTIASEGPEPLVVIAHSRGACDALAFALTEPGFVSDHVAAIFLVQGPFGGTALADYVVGDGPAMDGRMAGRHRVVASIVGRIERALVRKGAHAGLACLTRAESEDYWTRMRDDHAGAIPVIGPKTFFIASKTEPSRLGRFRRAIGHYLTIYDGPNDGIVCVEDQVVPGIGTLLCTLDCGHGDLTTRTGADKVPRRLRQALIRSVVMSVARPMPTPVASPQND